VEDFRRACGAHTARAEVVFEGDRHAVEGRQWASGAAARVAFAGGGAGRIRRHCDKCADFRVERLDARQIQIRDFLRCGCARGERLGQLRGGTIRHDEKAVLREDAANR